MALTTDQMNARIQAAVTQLNAAGSLTKLPTATQKNAYRTTATELSAVLAELLARKTCPGS